MELIKRLILNAILILFRLFQILPIRKKTIIFESFSGKQFSDNPKAIFNFMKKHYPEYKLYWSFDRRTYSTLKKNAKNPLKRFGFKWIAVTSRAEYWVTNSRFPNWIPKGRANTYIQTWHGTPLKKLGVDIREIHIPGTTTNRYRHEFTDETKKWDILISPNQYSTNIFKNAFQFNNKIIEIGYPRNDILYNNNTSKDIARLKRKMGLSPKKKIILYAPTWRDNDFYSIGKYKLNLMLDLKKVEKELGKDYIVLIRAHYLVAENLDLSPFKDFAYDMSTYPDISELYLISDILITDYSSVFFDYANLQRLMIFFTYDIESYRDKLRGFYFDIEKEAPGPIVRTTEEVIEEIQRFEREGYSINDYNDEFLERFCSLEDGRASERVVEYIINKE